MATLNHNSTSNKKRDAYAAQNRNQKGTDKYYKRNVTYKQASLIEKMSDLESLSEFEERFLTSVEGRRNLTAKQKKVLNQIYVKHEYQLN